MESWKQKLTGNWDVAKGKATLCRTEYEEGKEDELLGRLDKKWALQKTR